MILPLSSATRYRVAASQRESVAEMLFGENLRRRHERDLKSVLHRDNRREQGDDRLAGTDVALQQPLHRPRLLHVGDDFGERLALSFGQLERKHCPRRLPHPVVNRAHQRLAHLGVLLTAEGQPRLKDEEVLENQPPLRRRAESIECLHRACWRQENALAPAPRDAPAIALAPADRRGRDRRGPPAVARALATRSAAACSS